MLRNLLYRSGTGLVLAALTLVFAAGTVLAQTGRIEGTVRSAQTGDPVAGARVTVIGTAMVASTNENGYYAMEDVPVGTYNLRVRTIGFQSMTVTNQLVAAGLPTVVNFSLAVSILRIEGIVVTGVAEATQAVKLPFTVDQITTEDIPVPATSAEESIRGKIAGARVIRGDGRPGRGAQVLLRGATSISTAGRSNEPLYVVDGVILVAGESLTDIDALNIREIEVVKGAAASALFGARAANGVVSIKTQRGAALPEGETRVTVRTEFGQNNLFNRIPQAQAHWYAIENGMWKGTLSLPSTDARCTAGKSCTVDSLVPADNRANAQRLRPWEADLDEVTDSTDFDGDGTFSTHTYVVPDNAFPGRTFDNLDRFFDPGNFYTNTISFAHRSGNTNFLAAFHETKESGIVEGIDGYLRRGARVNVDHRIGTGLDFSASAFYSQSQADDPDARGALNPFYGLNFYPIDVDLLERDSSAQARIDLGTGSARDSNDYLIEPDPNVVEENPIYSARNADRDLRRSRVLGSVQLRWRPVEQFDLTTAVSFDRSDRNEQRFWFKGYRTIDPSGENSGRLRKSNSFDQTVNASLTAAFTERFGDLNLVSKVRVLIERGSGEFFFAQADKLAVDETQSLDIGDATINLIGSDRDEIRSLGYFLSTQLDYKDRYIVDALVRRDGSSLFGEDQRWHTYYRLSGAYRVALEEWWPFEILDEFKLRYSRGTAGGRPRFEAQYETFTVEAGSVGKGNLGNTALKPEFATEDEFGVDMIAAGRFSFSGNYARSTIEDQILLVPLAGYFGFSDQWQNAGTLETNSLEATIQAAVIQRADLTWNFNFVIDRTRQTITKFDLPAFTTGPSNAFFVREGEKLGTIYGHRWASTCGDILTSGLGVAAACDQFDLNDDGFLVPVGTGNVWTDGIDKNFYGSKITIDGRSFNWGMPIHSNEIVTNAKTGQVDTTTMVALGNTQPDYNWGISTNLAYKGISLYALFDAQIGGVIYNNTKQWANRENNAWDTDQSGKPASQRKTLLYSEILYDVNAENSYYTESGSYVKFRELAVRYTFDRSLLERWFGGFLKGVTLAVIGRNLYTFTDYSGYDPEVSNSGAGGGLSNNGIIFRFDGFGYPNYRTFTGSVELTF